MTEPTLFDAILERNAAMDAVDQATDEAWKSYAWEWLCAYLRGHREFFPDDAWSAGLEPPRERRAFGPIIQRAAREGLILKSGRLRQRKRGHGTPAEVWLSMVWEDVA